MTADAAAGEIPDVTGGDGGAVSQRGGGDHGVGGADRCGEKRPEHACFRRRRVAMGAGLN
jgi:hypothetical protein